MNKQEWRNKFGDLTREDLSEIFEEIGNKEETNTNPHYTDWIELNNLDTCVFNTYFEMRKDLEMNDIFDIFGITYEKMVIPTWEEIYKKIIDFHDGNDETFMWYIFCVIYSGFNCHMNVEDGRYFMKIFKSIFYQVIHSKKIEDLFDVCKDEMELTLYETVRFMVRYYFKNLTFPKWACEDFKVGIRCALLVDIGVVLDPNNSFSGFEKP